MDNDLTFIIQHAQDLVNENAALKLQVEALYNELHNKDERIFELEKQSQESAKMQAKQPEQLKIEGTPYSLQYVNALKSKLQEFAQANHEFYIFTEQQKKKYNEQLYFLKQKNDLLRKENNDITEQLQMKGIGLVSENKIIQTDIPLVNNKFIQTANQFNTNNENTGMNTEITALQVEEYILFKDTIIKYFDVSQLSQFQQNKQDPQVKNNAYQQLNAQLLSQFQQNSSKQQTPLITNNINSGTFANMFVSQRNEEQPAVAASINTNQKDDSIYEMQLHISKKPSTYQNTQISEDNIEIIDTLQANDSNLPSMDRNQLQQVSVARSNVQAYLDLQNNLGNKNAANVSETQKTVQHCSTENAQNMPGSVKHQSPKNSITQRVGNASQLHIVGSLQSSLLEPPISQSRSPPNSNSKRISVQFQQGVTLLTEKQPLYRVKIERNTHDENKFQIPLFQNSLQTLTKTHGLVTKPKGSNSRSHLSMDEAITVCSFQNSQNHPSMLSKQLSLIEMQDKNEIKDLSKNIKKKRARKPGDVQKLILPAVREKDKSPSIMNSFTSQKNDEQNMQPQELQQQYEEMLVQNKSQEDVTHTNSVAHTVIQLNDNQEEDQDKQEEKQINSNQVEKIPIIEQLNTSNLLNIEKSQNPTADLIDQVLEQDVNLDNAFENQEKQENIEQSIVQDQNMDEQFDVQSTEHLQQEESQKNNSPSSKEIAENLLVKVNSVEQVDVSNANEQEIEVPQDKVHSFTPKIEDTQTMSPEVINLTGRNDSDQIFSVKNMSVEHAIPENNAIDLPDENADQQQNQSEIEEKNDMIEELQKEIPKDSKIQEEQETDNNQQNSQKQKEKSQIEEQVQGEAEQHSESKEENGTIEEQLQEEKQNKNELPQQQIEEQSYDKCQEKQKLEEKQDTEQVNEQNKQDLGQQQEQQPQQDNINDPQIKEDNTEPLLAKSVLGYSAPIVDLEGLKEDDQVNSQQQLQYDGDKTDESSFVKINQNLQAEKQNKEEQLQEAKEEDDITIDNKQSLQAENKIPIEEINNQPEETPEILEDKPEQIEQQPQITDQSQKTDNSEKQQKDAEKTQNSAPINEPDNDFNIRDDFAIDDDEPQAIQLVEQPSNILAQPAQAQIVDDDSQSHNQNDKTDQIEVPESLQQIEEIKVITPVPAQSKDDNAIDVFEVNGPENDLQKKEDPIPIQSGPKKKKKKTRKDNINEETEKRVELKENDDLLDMLMPQLEKDLLG